jgi:ankyrin repeat protein
MELQDSTVESHKRLSEDDKIVVSKKQKTTTSTLFDNFARLSEQEMLDSIKLLFKNHGKWIFYVQDEEQNTFLHVAVQYGHQSVVKFLLQECETLMYEGCCYIDRQNSTKKTALHLAVKASKKDIVEILLKNNPDLTIVEDSVFLDINMAHPDAMSIIRLLCSYYQNFLRDGQEIPYLTLLTQVIGQSRQDILRELLKVDRVAALIKSNPWFLFIAIKLLDRDILKLLLEAGAPCNMPLSTGNTPLNELILQLNSQSKIKSLDLFQVLLESSGIIINRRLDVKNPPPIYTAVNHDKVPAIELLLQQDISIVEGNQSRIVAGEMPICSGIKKGSYKAVAYLVKNPSVIIDLNRCLTSIAAEEWSIHKKDVYLNIFRLLIRSGGAVDMQSNYLSSVLNAAFPTNPLCRAVIMKDQESMIKLLESDEYKAGLYNVDSDGATPLMYAAAQGNRPFVELLLSTPLLAKNCENHNVIDILNIIINRETFMCYEVKHKVSKQDLIAIKELIQKAIDNLALELMQMMQTNDERQQTTDRGNKDTLMLVLSFALGSPFFIKSK